MKATGYFIRDTLVNYDHLLSLPKHKQDKIKALSDSFFKIGYIDARTQIGPDQQRRMTEKQKKDISLNCLMAFKIEQEIKTLLKTDSEIAEEEKRKKSEEAAEQTKRIKYRIRDIENFLQHKLNSKRDNPTKKEYLELKNKLSELI